MFLCVGTFNLILLQAMDRADLFDNSPSCHGKFGVFKEANREDSHK